MRGNCRAKKTKRSGVSVGVKEGNVHGLSTPAANLTDDIHAHVLCEETTEVLSPARGSFFPTNYAQSLRLCFFPNIRTPVLVVVAGLLFFLLVVLSSPILSLPLPFTASSSQNSFRREQPLLSPPLVRHHGVVNIGTVFGADSSSAPEQKNAKRHVSPLRRGIEEKEEKEEAQVAFRTTHTSFDTFVDVDGSIAKVQNSNTLHDNDKATRGRRFEWAVRTTELNRTIKEEKEARKEEKEENAKGLPLVSSLLSSPELTVPERSIREALRAQRLICNDEGSLALAPLLYPHPHPHPYPSAASKSTTSTGQWATEANIKKKEENAHDGGGTMMPRGPFYVMGCDGGSHVGKAAHIISRLCVDYAAMTGGSPATTTKEYANNPKKEEEVVERHHFVYYAASRSSKEDSNDNDKDTSNKEKRILFGSSSSSVISWRHAVADVTRKISEKSIGGAGMGKPIATKRATGSRTSLWPADKIKISVKSEISTTFRSNLYPIFGVPSDVPMLDLDRDPVDGVSGAHREHEDDRRLAFDMYSSSPSYSHAYEDTYSNEVPTTIHVTYWHHKHFHMNLGHSLYRVLDMLRTATGLVRRGLVVEKKRTLRILKSSSSASSGPATATTVRSREEAASKSTCEEGTTACQRGKGLINGTAKEDGGGTGRARLAALILPEVSGRSMGPFIEPLLRASSLFDSGGVIVASPSEDDKAKVYSRLHGGMVSRREGSYDDSYGSPPLLNTAATAEGRPIGANYRSSRGEIAPQKQRKRYNLTVGSAAATAMFLYPPRLSDGDTKGSSIPSAHMSSSTASSREGISSEAIEMLTINNLKCYDNVVTNARGSPRFAEGIFDAFMKDVIVDFNRDMVQRWRLRDRCPSLFPPHAPNLRILENEEQKLSGRTEGRNPFRVVIINRRTTRRIENADKLREEIQAAYFRAFPLERREEEISSGRVGKEGEEEKEGRGDDGIKSNRSPSLISSFPSAAPPPLPTRREDSSSSASSLLFLPFEVQVVELEDYGPSRLASQAAVFHCSDVVIAVHGAALAWAVAMKTHQRDGNGREDIDGDTDDGGAGTLIEVLPYDWHLVSSPSATPIYKALYDAMGSVGVEYVPYALGELPRSRGGEGGKEGLQRGGYPHGYEKLVFSNNFEIGEKGLADLSALVVESFVKKRKKKK